MIGLILKASLIDKETNISSEKKWVIAISAMIIVIAIMHYITPVQLHHLHELYRVFFYLPIIFAAFIFQLRGGLISALIVIIIYMPHVVFQWGGAFLHNLGRFLEMIMYLAVGLVAGIISDREKRERLRYQRAATELEDSYAALKTQSEKLSGMEEQLRTSERLSLLGELSASLAHEVRNPLGSIWGAVEILQEKLRGNPEHTEFLSILVKEVKRLNKVVENYLSLGRQPNIDIQRLDLKDVINSILFLFQLRTVQKNIELKTDLPERNILVRGDENQLRQILTNLLLNAIAAIGESGSITLRLEEMDNGMHHKAAVKLSVSDSGSGISKEELNNIFTPFYTTRKAGTGLGLSIVKRIADQYKWKLEISSTPGTGTTISLIMPKEEINDI
ncbi:MAG: ATP-binding protein [candidate division KSB1 bacterium]|jgi:signal transduction histidine kinase|nr:ATP-binding protein [candidate division KSB1 bacterium]